MDLIVGMHRSGSSLVCRILVKAGANFGDPAGFFPPDKWNPEGYCEQMEILRLNRLLLHGFLGKLAFLFPPSTQTVRKRAQRIVPALRAAIIKFDSCVIKDPRFNFTGPIWEQYGAHFSKMIVCLRDPLESARSLRRRNRLPIPLGLAVWQNHYDRLLANYGTRDLWVVNYSRLVAADSCVQEVRGVIQYLDLPSRNELEDTGIKQYVRLRDPDGAAGKRPCYPEDIMTILRRFEAIQQQQWIRNPARPQC